MVRSNKTAKTRVCVLHVDIRLGRATTQSATKRSAEARLEEACGLALAIDIELVNKQVVPLRTPKPATLIGQGVVESVADLVQDQEVELVIIDASLTPIQQRNLEEKLNCKVIDRTGLILEIFGERARTAEGTLQVELAALTYQRSRLVRSWTHLERQRGGYGFLGGPGEAQIELDRRMLDERIVKIKKELEQTKRTRGLHRQARKRIPYPIVALVGYTNAGKSTLFNHLTNAKVFAEDLLFATLDPTMRQIVLPSGREVILSDTVGFISELPTQLIAAFRATLEEVVSADLIVHVRDISHPDTIAQKEDVEKVLCELGLEQDLSTGQFITAYNKIDLLDEEKTQCLKTKIVRDFASVGLSAISGEGAEDLLSLVDRRLSEKRQATEVDIPVSSGEVLSWCYRNGNVTKREDTDDTIHLTVQLDPENVPKLKKMLKKK